MRIPPKILLTEQEMPTQWYNILAGLPKPFPAPPSLDPPAPRAGRSGPDLPRVADHARGQHQALRRHS